MTRCECGKPKRPNQAACERCLYLDGRGRVERLIIEALRLAGGSATQQEIFYAVGERAYYRHVRALERAGRCVRRDIESARCGTPERLVTLVDRRRHA